MKETLFIALQRVWHTLDLEQEGKGKAGKRKITPGSTTTVGLLCRYRVACMFFLLELAYMAHTCGFLVKIYHCLGGFPRLTVDFPSLIISWIAMVLWVHFIVCFSGWFSCSFSCGLSY